jgi:hypothetical protein
MAALAPRLGFPGRHLAAEGDREPRAAEAPSAALFPGVGRWACDLFRRAGRGDVSFGQLAATICISIAFTLLTWYISAGNGSPSMRSKDFVKILRLLAGLAALILTASAASATVIDLRAALGPSGHYTSRAYYRSLLGGQPMTADQQAYADQEDHLRLLGFLSESGGDFALGQIFYRIAYGIIPPSPGLDLAGGGSTGGSDLGSASSGLVAITNPDVSPAIAAPEASTWVMMAIGFMGLGFTGWRARQRTGAGPC